MRRLCPTAAAACLCGRLLGYSGSPSFSMPHTIAPEETITISRPCAFKTASSLASRSMRSVFRPLPLEATRRLPTLSTRRLASLTIWSRMLMARVEGHGAPCPYFFATAFLHDLSQMADQRLQADAGDGRDRKASQGAFWAVCLQLVKVLPLARDVELRRGHGIRLLGELRVVQPQLLAQGIQTFDGIHLDTFRDVHQEQQIGRALDVAQKLKAEALAFVRPLDE